MKYLVLEYPKCSTCKKALHYLDEHHINYEKRHIVENHPTEEELKQWIKESGREVKSFFNTSGNLYKELHLKDKLPTMTVEEQIKLLASNGMLVKRPLLIGDRILSGFKEKEWEGLK